jgi:cytidylate kinase
LEKKQVVDLDDIIKNIEKRDFIDTTRAEGPLKRADDAYTLDTTFMTVDEQVDFVIHLVTGKVIESHNNLLII